MAVEKIITPTPYIAGTTNRATLKLRFKGSDGHRTRINIAGLGSYRMRGDGTRFSARADGGRSRNAVVIDFYKNGTALIRTGEDRFFVSDLTFSLVEGRYTVVCA